MEDADLPENLEDEQVFLHCREQHEEQKKATWECEKRAKRTLELMALKDEIIETRERAKQMEWEAEMCVKEKELEKNNRILMCRRREQEIQKAQEEKVHQCRQLEKLQTDMTHKDTGENPLIKTTRQNGHGKHAGSISRALFTQEGVDNRSDMACTSGHSQVTQGENIDDLEVCA